MLPHSAEVIPDTHPLPTRPVAPVSSSSLTVILRSGLISQQTYDVRLIAFRGGSSLIFAGFGAKGRPVGGFALRFLDKCGAVPGSEPYREAVACSDLFRGGWVDFPFSHDLSNAGSRASAVGAPAHSVVPGAAPRAAAPRRARAAGLSRNTPKEGFSYEASSGVVGSCGAVAARGGQRPARHADVQRMVVLVRGQRERLLGVLEDQQQRPGELERPHRPAPRLRHLRGEGQGSRDEPRRTLRLRAANPERRCTRSVRRADRHAPGVPYGRWSVGSDPGGPRAGAV